MPCKCSGYRLEKCKCQLVRSSFPLNPADGQFVILSQNESACFKPRRSAKRSTILKAAEHLYEKCAGFNLRHCPLRRFPGSDNYFREVLKELFWLLCFLVANLVVFAAIFTRMALHMSLVVAAAARWIRRSIRSKMVPAHGTSCDLRSYGDKQDEHHNFLPPCYRS